MSQELDQAILQYWTAKIKSRYLYRAQYQDSLWKLRLFGLTSKKHPLTRLWPMLEQFWVLVERLEREGLIIYIMADRKRPASHIISWDRKQQEGIDFTSDYDEAINIYLEKKGGALVTNNLEMIGQVRSGNGFKRLNSAEINLINVLEKELLNIRNGSRPIIIQVSMGSKAFNHENYFHPEAEQFIGDFSKFKAFVYYRLKNHTLAEFQALMYHMEVVLSKKFYYRIVGRVRVDRVEVM